MENVIQLATLRQSLLTLIVNNPRFSAAEQLRANHAAHECEDAGRLSRWLRNVLRLLADGSTSYAA